MKLCLLPLALALAACAHAPRPPASHPDLGNDVIMPTVPSEPPPKPPVVTIDAQSVSLDGTKVLDADAVTGPETDRVAPFVLALRARPSPTPPNIVFDVKPDAKSHVAAYVLDGASDAGYTKVHFAGAGVMARLDPYRTIAAHTAVRVGLSPDGATIAWGTDAPCDRAPHGERVAEADLPAAFARGCNGKACIDQALFLATDDVPFDRLVDALAAAFSQATDRFTFRFGVPKGPPYLHDVCGAPVTLALGADDVVRVVMREMGALRRCYDEAQEHNPDASGHFDLRLTIDHDGHVTDASTGDATTFPDLPATSCILRRARAFVFPKVTFGASETTLAYPFDLSPDTPAPPASVIVSARGLSLDGLALSGADDLVLKLRARRAGSLEIAFEAKPDAKTPAALAALEAGALSGYTTVRFAGTDLVVPEAADFVPMRRALFLTLDPRGAHFSWPSDASCDESPPAGSADMASLAPALARACGAAPCIDELSLVAGEGVPFANVVSAIAAAAKQGTSDFRLVLGHRGAPTSTFLCADPILVNSPSPALYGAVHPLDAPMDRCFEAARKRKPNLHGDVRLRLVVAPDGRVQAASAAPGSSLADAAATSCIVTAARKLSFPAGTFGTAARTRTVIYPVSFWHDYGVDAMQREREMFREQERRGFPY